MRRVLFALLIALLAALIVGGLGELRQRQIEATDAIVIPTDAPGLKYEMRPGPLTNSHGYKERELPIEKPAGTLRVAVVGDSVTHGAFVPAEQVYSRVVEDQLHAAGRTDVQVLNFAAYGYDIDSLAALVRYRARAWSPDLIVYGYYVNDQIPTQMVTAAGQPIWVGARPFTVLAPGLDGLLHDRSALFRKYEGAKGARYLASLGKQPPSDWDFFRNGLSALLDAAGQTPVVVLLIPPHVFVQPSMAACNASAQAGPWFCEGNLEILQQALTIFRERGLMTVDGSAAYRAGPVVDLHGVPTDPHHPNPEGHRRLASALVAPVLQALRSTP